MRENAGQASPTLAYQNVGRETAVTRGNRGVGAYAYDGASRLIVLGIDAVGSANDKRTDLSYDPAGWIGSRRSYEAVDSHPAASELPLDSRTKLFCVRRCIPRAGRWRSPEHLQPLLYRP
jgi:hypothetical protein